MKFFLCMNKNYMSFSPQKWHNSCCEGMFAMSMVQMGCFLSISCILTYIIQGKCTNKQIEPTDIFERCSPNIALLLLGILP